MKSSALNVTRISMMTLRTQLGALLDRVFYRHEHFIVERAGKPKAVLMPLSEYEALQRRTSVVPSPLSKKDPSTP